METRFARRAGVRRVETMERKQPGDIRGDRFHMHSQKSKLSKVLACKFITDAAPPLAPEAQLFVHRSKVSRDGLK